MLLQNHRYGTIEDCRTCAVKEHIERSIENTILFSD